MSQLPDLPQLPETEWKLHMPARQYECEWTSSEYGYTSYQMLEYANQYAALAVSAERERCAKICEDLESDGMSWLEAGTCAAAIRSQP